MAAWAAALGGGGVVGRGLGGKDHKVVVKEDDERKTRFKNKTNASSQSSITDERAEGEE